MKLGIAGKLTILLTVFSLVISGLTALHVYQASRALLTKTAQERLLTTTQVLGRRYINVIDSASQDARRLADSPDALVVLTAQDTTVARERADELVAQFKSQLKFNPEYYQIRLISASEHGLERVRVDREDGSHFVRVADSELQEKGFYPYVFETLKLLRGGVYISPIQINHELGAHAGLDKPTVRISVPIFSDTSNHPLGLIVMNLSLKGIFSLLGEDLPKGHEVYMANKDGEFIVHPDPTAAFAFDQGRSNKVQTQFPATSGLYSSPPQTTVFADKSSINGRTRPVAATFIRVNLTDIPGTHFFVLGLAQSLNLVLADTQTLTASTIPVMLGFVAVAIILAIWLGRAFTKPLRHIADEVSQFQAQSKVSDNLPIQRPDEIGVLALGILGMQIDIKEKLDELNHQRMELHYQAHHDSLTGLPNRLMLEEQFNQMLTHAQETGALLAVLFIDLDRFKHINDRYGHEAGDVVLRETALRLQNAVRKSDVVVRMGGDEFIILIEDLHDQQQLRYISEKLTGIIVQPISWNSQELHICASIGIAYAPTDGDNIDKLSSCADARMYQAKAAGGSKVVYFSPQKF